MNADTGTEVTQQAPEAEKVEKVEAAPEAEKSPERDEQGKFRKPVQPRIDELTRQRREAERERDYWRAQAALRQETEAPKAEKPTPDKFTDYNEYVEALAEWKADQKIETKLAEREKVQAEKSAAEKRAQAWRESTEAVQKEMPDFNEVIEAAADTPISNHLREIMDESDNRAKLLYHFAKNPDVVEKLNAMSPTAAAREVGRIEVAFDRPATPPVEKVEEETPPPPVKRTNAPPPAKQSGSGRSTAVDLGKASMDDYIATRVKQGARWARR